jgi:hypothetical protein
VALAVNCVSVRQKYESESTSEGTSLAGSSGFQR